MLKKLIVITGILLMPMTASAQMTEIVEETLTGNNEFFVTGNFINLAPVNNFLAAQNLGFSTLGDNLLMYGIASRNMAGDNVSWGLVISTTLEGFDLVETNLLKRDKERFGTDPSNQAKFSMVITEFVIDYQAFKLGGFSIGGGVGIGFGGAKITLLGDKSGSFRIASFLFTPEMTFSYHLLEDASGGIILSLTGGYNFFSNREWQREAGALDYPDKFDMSGAYATFSIGIPTAK